MTDRAAFFAVVPHAQPGTQSIDPEQLISDDVAADALHVKRETLAAWRHQRRGPPYVKIGRRCLYTRASIAEYIARQFRDPQAA